MQIKELRKAAGLTQQQLAEAVSVSQATVAEWELGIYMPSANKLRALADALGCTINDLFAQEPA